MKRSDRPIPSSGILQIFAVVLMMCFLYASSASGAEPSTEQKDSCWVYELRAGVLAHDVPGLWSGSRKEGGVDFSAELIFSRPSFSLLWGIVRPNLGMSLNNQGDTSKLYAGMLWEFQMESGIFLNLGVDGAVHDGESETSEEDGKELGSRFLFRIPIEIGYALNEHHRLSILYEHLSNGYLTSPNEGLDTLGIRYGYRF
jgi:hypothetical protein